MRLCVIDQQICTLFSFATELHFPVGLKMNLQKKRTMVFQRMPKNAKAAPTTRQRHMIDIGPVLTELQEAAKKVGVNGSVLARLLIKNGLEQLRANGFKLLGSG